jgi:hypothetical protein
MGEHNLSSMPTADGPGFTARRGVALLILGVVTQTRRLPRVAGFEGDVEVLKRVEPYAKRIDALEGVARRIADEGAGG